MEELYQIAPSMMLKKAASRIGFALLAVILISEALSFSVAYFFPDYTIFSSVLLQLVGIPIGCLILLKMPRDYTSPAPFAGKKLFAAFCICMSLSTIGSLVGITVSQSFSSLFGAEASNPIADLSQRTSPLFIFIMSVLIAPFFEEFLFRKVIIDRLVHFGEWNAIFFSALAFGLFHGNLMQFFYAFMVGAVFGYVYVKTRCIWYTVLLHGLMNLVANISDLVSTASDTLIPVLQVLFTLTIAGASIAGIVFLTLFIVREVKRHSPDDRLQPASFANVGIILFFVLTTAELVLYLIPFNS